jgi:hypothetical protein
MWVWTVNMWAWTNIIWHIGQNIWWCGGIFCHMFMDEWYLWMKLLMTNENGRTLSWMLATICFLQKTKQNNEKTLCCFVLKILEHEMLKSYFKSYFILV